MSKYLCFLDKNSLFKNKRILESSNFKEMKPMQNQF